MLLLETELTLKLSYLQQIPGHKLVRQAYTSSYSNKRHYIFKSRWVANNWSCHSNVTLSSMGFYLQTILYQVLPP